MQGLFLCLLPPKVYKKTRQLIQFNKLANTGKQGYFGYDMEFLNKK